MGSKIWVVFASTGSIFDIAQIPQEGDKMESKYSFVAKFINGVTEVETFGEDWIDEMWTGSTAISKINRNMNDSQKGNIGVIFRNVGKFGNTTVDLKITFTDWNIQQVHSTTGIGVRTNTIEYFDMYMRDVSQVWEFLESGTDNLINISGYMTMKDIDEYQSVTFSKDTVQNISEFFVYDEDNVLSFSNNDGEYSIYADFKTGYGATDSKVMVTYTFSSSTIKFNWYSGGEKTGIAWSLFQFDAKKPMPSEISAPVKVASDLNEERQTNNSLSSLDEKFSYIISHTVPDEHTAFWYKSYVMEDTLPECLSIKVSDIKIFNEIGTDVTNRFDVGVTGNKIIASAKSSFLSTAAFYFNTYSFVIDTQIKDGENLSLFTDSQTGAISFQNQATITADGDLKYTNNVKTTVPTYTVTHDFMSGTSGKELPSEITDLIPTSYNKILSGTELEPKGFDSSDIIVPEGTWTFKSWNEDEMTIVSNFEFVGTWEFEINKYTVTHYFVSGTSGKDLPKEITDLIPTDYVDVEYGTKVEPKTFDSSDVIVPEGTWTFKSWDEDEMTIVSNFEFVGTWEFEINKYIVTHEFVSGTTGRELPQEIVDMIPTNYEEIEYGTTLEPKAFGSLTFIAPEGKWIFKEWNEDEVNVVSNFEFVGVWELEVNKYKVNHVFVSYDGRELPQEIINLIPTDYLEIEYGTVINPKLFNTIEIEVAEGFWTYIEWDNNELNIVSDGTFTGVWKLIPKYTVVYDFESDSKRELPIEVLNLIPEKVIGKEGEVIISPNVTNKVEVEDGTWIFKSWDKGQVELDEDKFVIGVWTFEEKTSGGNTKTDDTELVNTGELYSIQNVILSMVIMTTVIGIVVYKNKKINN